MPAVNLRKFSIVRECSLHTPRPSSVLARNERLWNLIADSDDSPPSLRGERKPSPLRAPSGPADR
jgi:hypothetical protein